MKLNVDTKYNKVVAFDVSAKGEKEVEAALTALMGFMPKDENEQAQQMDAYGNTIITLDNMAEALAILNQNKSRSEFVKFIRRISGMGLKEARDWVDAHFTRWT